MPLSGTLDTMPITDLIQWLNASDADGTLTVSLDMEDTFIVFKEGDVSGLGSDDPLRWDVGHVLLARGLITEETLRDAVRRAGGSGNAGRGASESGNVGRGASESGNGGRGQAVEEVLVADGVLTQKAIEEAVVDHGFKTILDLFFEEEGSFYFSSAAGTQGLLGESFLPQVRFFQKPLSGQEILMDGVRRMDEWGRIQEVFPSAYCVVHGLGVLEGNQVTRALVELGEPVSVGELCLALRSKSRFSVYRELFDGYEAGVVGLDSATAGPESPFSLGPTDSLIVNARVLLEHRQFDEARAVLSTALNLDPGNGEARRLLRDLRASHLEHLYKQIPPHKVPKLSVSREELNSYGLASQERYLASRIDGKWDVATLVVVTPLGELRTLRALGKFLHAGIVGFERDG